MRSHKSKRVTGSKGASMKKIARVDGLTPGRNGRRFMGDSSLRNTLPVFLQHPQQHG